MPLPPYLIGADLYLCERVLQEADGVISTIRVVDLLTAPAGSIPSEDELANANELALPVSTITIVANLKAVPAHAQRHDIRLDFVNTTGEVGMLFHMPSAEFRPKTEGATTAMGFIIPINVAIRRVGVCFISLLLDEEEVARTPLTLVQAQPQQPDRTSK